ncbi:MAG: hydroxymethylbilane synthase, partial [Ilumatobacteraceae bacterium]
PKDFVPAVGQGAVAVECRTDDHATRAALATVTDPDTYDAVSVERAWLRELGSGCSSPVGAHVIGATLWAFLAGDAGVQRRQLDLVGDASADHAAAAGLARAMRDAAMVR